MDNYINLTPYMYSYENNIKYKGILTKDDLKYQEERRKRKVRKLEFEER